jgi:branched-chain amino acid transport system ATP-binding protein
MAGFRKVAGPMGDRSPMDAVRLRVRDISISFGGIKALEDVDLEVRGNEILSVIGPNGAGKTSLLNCICGFYKPEKGSICFEEKDCTHLLPHKRAELGMGRTFQGVQLYQGMSVLDNIMAGRHVRMKTNIFQSALYWVWARKEEKEHRAVAEEIIDFLNMKSIQGKVAADLSYGLMKRVDLGRALALEPRILIMDEPVAGMNLTEKEEFAQFILNIREDRKIPIVLVEHDMGMVMDISDRIVVLDWGKVIAEGSPEQIKGDPRVISAYLGKVSA